jgi:hypothetical protein
VENGLGVEIVEIGFMTVGHLIIGFYKVIVGLLFCRGLWYHHFRMSGSAF